MVSRRQIHNTQKEILTNSNASITCRQRKLKCDEQKPRCGPCVRASRECVPSTGIVFRHQQNASMNGGGEESASSLKGFYAYKNTFDEGSIWVDIPKTGRVRFRAASMQTLTRFSHVYGSYRPVQ